MNLAVRCPFLQCVAENPSFVHRKKPGDSSETTGFRFTVLQNSSELWLLEFAHHVVVSAVQQIFKDDVVMHAVRDMRNVLADEANSAVSHQELGSPFVRTAEAEFAMVTRGIRSRSEDRTQILISARCFRTNELRHSGSARAIVHEFRDGVSCAEPS